MIIRFLVLVLFLPAASFAQGEWIKIDSPTTHNLNTLFLYDSLNFWAAGDSGIILYSSDGGDNWNIQATEAKYNITDMHFTDPLIGNAVGVRNIPPFTMFYKTRDGGLTWQSQPYADDLIAIYTLFFTDELTGYCGGGNGLILKTDDGGERWSETTVDSFRLDVNDIRFLNDSTGFACGGIRDFSGVIWKSTDNGENWSHTVIPFEPVWELYFIDSVNFIGIGGDFEYGTGVMRTSDAGGSWDYQSLDIRGVGTSISFRTSREVWAALGSDRILIYSLDSGYTWTSVPSPDSTFISDLEFSDSLHGIAVGEKGAIYKYRNKIINEINEIEALPGEFYLNNNYPNPFNSQTVISFYLPEASDVKITVNDVLGNTVLLYNDYKSKGHHKQPVNMNTYASGIYFYNVSYKGKVLGGKMVYLK